MGHILKNFNFILRKDWYLEVFLFFCIILFSILVKYDFFFLPPIEDELVNYVSPAFKLSQEGLSFFLIPPRYLFHPPGLIIFGAIIATFFGFSFFSIKIITMSLFFLSLVALYKLLKIHFGKFFSSFCIILVALNPLFLTHNTTFHPDIFHTILVPFLFLSIEKDKKWTIVFLSLIGILLRETFIITYLGVVLYAFLRKKDLRFFLLLFFSLLTLLCAFYLFASFSTGTLRLHPSLKVGQFNIRGIGTHVLYNIIKIIGHSNVIPLIVGIVAFCIPKVRRKFLRTKSQRNIYFSFLAILLSFNLFFSFHVNTRIFYFFPILVLLPVLILLPIKVLSKKLMIGIIVFQLSINILTLRVNIGPFYFNNLTYFTVTQAYLKLGKTLQKDYGDNSILANWPLASAFITPYFGNFSELRTSSRGMMIQNIIRPKFQHYDYFIRTDADVDFSLKDRKYQIFKIDDLAEKDSLKLERTLEYFGHKIYLYKIKRI